MDVVQSHFVTGRALGSPWDERFAIATFGMGCFWGVERLFWPLDGVWVTAVGYAGGHTERPDYRSVCDGRTGHAEVVRVVFDPNRIRYEDLLRVFWENHDPTQGMRQGNDVGSQYRSLIVASDATQRALAESSRNRFAELLASAGFGPITTEIVDDVPFWMAEEYHQQYLAKNPNGYCGIAGTGVACPVGIVG